MKLVKTASGKTRIKMNRQEWSDMGKKAGWLKKADFVDQLDQLTDSDLQRLMNRYSYIKTKEDAIKLLINAEDKAVRTGRLHPGCSLQEVMNVLAPRKKINITPEDIQPRKKINITPEDIQ